MTDKRPIGAQITFDIMNGAKGAIVGQFSQLLVN